MVFFFRTHFIRFKHLFHKDTTRIFFFSNFLVHTAFSDPTLFRVLIILITNNIYNDGNNFPGIFGTRVFYIGKNTTIKKRSNVVYIS